MCPPPVRILAVAAATLGMSGVARADRAWVSAETGAQSINLQTFDASDQSFTVGLVPTSATGPALALGGGFRLGLLTLGGRISNARFDDPSVERTVGAFDLWSIDGELGFRFPVAIVEPYVVLGGGYSVFGGLDDALDGVRRGMDIDGVNLRSGLGIDLRPFPALSLGARFSADVMVLSRRGIPVRELAEAKRIDTLGDAERRALEADGASIGTGWSLTAVLGLHL